MALSDPPASRTPLPSSERTGTFVGVSARTVPVYRREHECGLCHGETVPSLDDAAHGE